ncbi:hypothetical protein DS884_01940 [Tenacibaculum sp. E3R01]|uniref:LamG-like jellyroll fold domain-containing protein n=1 Tax=Tenacibaculum sp. E3R01 TaxID=2267227 RepID=UPI000DEAF8E3|nr:LamG-like jellyroll fold domain-containing protein [Tenacibaculum sp. E3R01]RBW62383.1 hypothetical protein DS884_01940 [Tenacibaculum sp. E3R01]
MRKNKIIGYLLIALLSSFSFVHAQQSYDLAVLQIQSKGKYSRVFNPQTNLNSLLSKGITNRATVEFWAMHNTASSGNSEAVNWEFSNLKTGSEEFKLSIQENKVSLKIGVSEQVKNLLLDNKVFKNIWHHYAFSIDKSANELRVYIDGIEHFFKNISNFNVEEIYFSSDKKTDLFLAEYRGWSTAKRKKQIKEQQYRTFYKEAKNSLLEQKNNGLEIVYTNTNYKNEDFFGGDVLTSISWQNLLYEYFPDENLIKEAEFSSKLKSNNISNISSEIQHPVLNLNKIIVRASDGDGIDNPLLSGSDGIFVEWQHVRNVDEYIIKRRNLRAGTISSVVHTMKDTKTKNPSESLFYVDKGILPNELYEYTIEAKHNGVTTLTGKDVGFVLPNGKVKGLIETSSSVATKFAKVEAIASGNINPGGALKFIQGKKPLLIKNIDAFRKAKGGATFEFWYKTPTITEGENTVLSIGNSELILQKSKIVVKLNGSTYVAGTRKSDTNWHHYAFTFNASGGTLFEDGTPISNGSSATLFALSLNNVNTFSLNKITNVTYYIDEVRFWNAPRSPLQINEYANHIIGGNVENLFAYYRFDFNDAHKAYNFSTKKRGEYLIESESVLEHLSANEQPQITYATYTNKKGDYKFTSLNTGIQGITNNDNKFEYTIKPSKPRFEFLPKTKQASVPRRLNGDLATNVNFTDVSSLPITGVISYRVGDELYPVLRGTALKVDGSIVQSNEDSKVTTDNTGTYAIKTAPGNHVITPNPMPSLANEERLNEGSLRFDGKTGYARSINSITNNGNSFTWSGFVKPYLKTSNEDKVPAIQTVLQWGNLSLKLINNTILKVYTGTQERLSENLPTNSLGQFSFFSISFDKEKGTMSLYVNDRRKNTSINSLEIASNLIVGSEEESNTFKNFSKSHIDLLEYRAVSLLEDDIAKLKQGKYLAIEQSKLQLSYSFDQKYGTKAINTVVDGVNNNYLQFEGGCNFDNTSHKQYVREIKYTYKATNSKFNPTGNHYEVVLEEPLQNVNFENITRRSFIGNIVVPCNNSVGAWTGKIIRTDIEFPKFEKTISSADFNNDTTVFTINDLLPGQYRVEITNTNANRVLKSPIIDLRRKNIVYDFEFRNPIELEIELFKFDMAGVRDIKNMRDYVGDKISSTCEGSFTFKSHDGFKMNVNVFERYGVNKCPVEGADVTLGGDAVLADSNLTDRTLSKGVLEFFTQVSSPNFLGDHSRNFLISVSHNGRTASITKKAIILGARQGNSDFTLIEPQVGFVLHDPPGDNSSATLAKGATYSYSFSAENGIGLEIDNSIGAKLKVKKQILTGIVAAPLGVGTVAGFVNPVLQTSSDTQGLIGGKFDYLRHSGNSETVTLEKSISTPSDPTYVGEDADVFIGTSKVITFGTGQVLKLNGCSPVVQNSNKVAKPSSVTPFAYTKQSLNDIVIPNLYQLAIAKYDKNNGIVSPPKDRNHLDLKGTLEKLLAKTPKDKEDKDIINYLHQISRWTSIIDKNHNKRTKAYFDSAPNFSSTTKKLTNDNDVGQSGAGLNASALDKRITFDALTEISYTLSREKTKSSGNSFSGGPYVGVSFSTDFTIFGAGLTFNNQTKVHNFNSRTDSDENGNNRVDSFTLNDDDAGDHFDVLIRRDPEYDTPMFLTNAGRSSCPFESGTVPREGVELIVDKVVGYGTGDESILYNLTLRNTQVAKDATRKTYIVGMAGASNSLGAVVNLNESPIFEPTTSSKFVFDLDPSSPTGVKQEIKAQLRIARGTDAPSVISYKDIKIQMYSECEQAGDRYRSYGVDEYNEVGVKPYAEILVTAHFTGACIETITSDSPQNDWIVNGSDKKKLDFNFRIPELKGMSESTDFSVDLEYTIKGNNDPKILKKLDLKTLKKYLNSETDQVEYSADVSALTNGEYNFRIVPVCGDGGSDNPNNRKNPTPFVKGKIARNAPQLVLTTPDNGGIFTSGTISAKFSAPINPATVNLNSLAMRGVLGGVPKPLTSVKMDNVTDVINIPHNNKFNLEDKLTIEMWVNPLKYPSGVNVPIIQKGGNYHVSLMPDGKIITNDGVKSSKGIQPFTWTHVSVVYDKTNGNAVIYFNGENVGSGNISTIENKVNSEKLVISPMVTTDSFVGSLDEVRVWQSARSPLQIASNMKNQLLGNEDTLEAYFVFNDNTLAKQGINGAPNEAIQDFTGNAQGTTATGINFVTNEEAAPLDKTKTVEDIQFTTTMSENNTIINFNMKISDLEFVEGARLTVFVKDKKLQDPLGNKIDKTSWSFIINRSKLKWSHNNLSISQNQGETTIIDNIDLINSDGGIDVAYTFENLPVWFNVKKGANPAKDALNIIRATETNRDLEFEIKNYLNPGVHTAIIYIKTSNKNTGQKLGVESFRLEVTVNCPEPAIASGFENNYPLSMNFKGNLIINSQNSVDINDVVKVYVGNQIRGYAKVGASGLVDLTVFGNIGETSVLNFKVWDASKCTEYEGIIENYSFNSNQTIGSNSVPVKFTVGEKVTRRIPVVQGYQELSFNLKDNQASNKLSLTAIKGLPVNSQILDLLNNKVAVLGSNNIFTGGLTEIDVTKAYLVSIAPTHEVVKYIEISGVPVDLDNNLSINGGNIKNAIPFYPNDLQRTGYALRSFTSTKVSEGDRIERRGLFAEYTTSSGWRGSLTHLTPGLGYIFKSQNAGAINYSGIIKNAVARSVAKNTKVNNALSNSSSELEETPSYKELDLTIDLNQFADFMYINGVLETADLDTNKAYTILALVDNELRGASKAEFINGEYHYYIGIGSNSDENVQFKLYDGNSVLDLENTEMFFSNKTIGTMNSPYSFTVKSKEVELSKNYTLALSQNRPNPMNEHTQISFSTPKEVFVDLSLYNMLGQKLHTFVARKVTGNRMHTINWNGVAQGHKLQSGVYVYELRVEGKRLQRKLIIE